MRSVQYQPDGCKETYTIFENGDIYRNRDWYKVHQPKNADGYPGVFFTCDGKSKRVSVHRLMMLLFYPIDNADKMVVNHKDGNKANNNLDNLEWCTSSENSKHAFRTGLKSANGEKNSHAKLTEKDVLEIRKRLKNGESGSALAREYGVQKTAISRIKLRKSWSHLKDEDE